MNWEIGGRAWRGQEKQDQGRTVPKEGVARMQALCAGESESHLLLGNETAGHLDGRGRGGSHGGGRDGDDAGDRLSVLLGVLLSVLHRGLAVGHGLVAGGLGGVGGVAGGVASRSSHGLHAAVGRLRVLGVSHGSLRHFAGSFLQQAFGKCPLINKCPLIIYKYLSNDPQKRGGHSLLV